MRKAKITACGCQLADIKMEHATIGVEFKVEKSCRYAHVFFNIEVAKKNLDQNIQQKCDVLLKYLMKYVRQKLDDWSEGDADTTDLENIMRLKMPLLLRKAVNMEYFVQKFDH